MPNDCNLALFLVDRQIKDEIILEHGWVMRYVHNLSRRGRPDIGQMVAEIVLYPADDLIFLQIISWLDVTIENAALWNTDFVKSVKELYIPGLISLSGQDAKVAQNIFDAVEMSFHRLAIQHAMFTDLQQGGGDAVALGIFIIEAGIGFR